MKIHNVNFSKDLKEFRLNSFFQTQEWLNLFKEHWYNNCSKIFEFENWVKVYLPLNCIKKWWFLKWAISTNLWWYWWFIFNQDLDFLEKEKCIIKILKYLKREYSYISIVPYLLDRIDYNFLKEEDFTEKKTFSHILELSSDITDIMKNKYKKVFRYELRKSLKEKIYIKEWNWKEYYPIYLENLKKWWKKDNLWKSFFKKMSKVENIKFIFAYYNDKIISAAVFFFYWNEIFYWASYTNEKFKSLFWIKQVIYYIHNKYWQEYELFNCWSSEWLPWVQRFKESFWAEKKEYFYYEYKSYFVKFLFLIKNILWRK